MHLFHSPIFGTAAHPDNFDGAPGGAGASGERGYACAQLRSETAKSRTDVRGPAPGWAGRWLARLQETPTRAEDESAPIQELERRLVLTAVGVACAAVLVQTATTLTSRIAFGGRFDRVDATLEGNIWTWAAAGATLTAAAAAAACATTDPPARLRFGALAAALVYFSLDDWFMVHEAAGARVEEAFGLPDYVGGLWVLAYAPLLLLVVWGLIAAARESLPPVRLGLVLALVLFVASVLVELIGIPTKALARNGVEWPHDIRSAVEEGLELGAWIIATGALFGSFAERATAAIRGGRA